MYLFPVPSNSQQSSAPPLIDEYERRIQRISMILFILLFIPSITIIIFYALPLKITIPNTNTGTMVKTVMVQTPSLMQYTQLNSVYPQTLQCTCSKASINYDKFIHTEYSLHQVCSSMFVEQSWIDYLQQRSGIPIFINDFRSTGSSTFQALRTFCQLIDRTIMDGLNRFYSNQYVSTSVIPSQLWELEITLLIYQFRSSLKNSFSLSLAMIRDMIQANALFSGLGRNYDLQIVNNNSYVSVFPVSYDNCSCASSSTCVTPSSIYNYTNQIRLFNIRGLYTGCYVTEALLKSTLECFYDQQCISQIQSFLTSSSPMQVTALDSSLPSLYSMSSTIKELVDNLMIEQWSTSSSYERYYNECQPSQCTYNYNSTGNVDDIVYTFEPRKNIIHIVIILLAIIGGLTAVLLGVVLLLARSIMFCFGKKRTNIVP
jgi:hypothetical protein